MYSTLSIGLVTAFSHQVEASVPFATIPSAAVPTVQALAQQDFPLPLTTPYLSFWEGPEQSLDTSSHALGLALEKDGYTFQGAQSGVVKIDPEENSAYFENAPLERFSLQKTTNASVRDSLRFLIMSLSSVFVGMTWFRAIRKFPLSPKDRDLGLTFATFAASGFGLGLSVFLYNDVLSQDDLMHLFHALVFAIPSAVSMELAFEKADQKQRPKFSSDKSPLAKAESLSFIDSFFIMQKIEKHPSKHLIIGSQPQDTNHVLVKKQGIAPEHFSITKTENGFLVTPLNGEVYYKDAQDLTRVINPNGKIFPKGTRLYFGELPDAVWTLTL